MQRYLGSLALNAGAGQISDVLVDPCPYEGRGHHQLRPSHSGVREVVQLTEERMPVVLRQVRLDVAGRCIRIQVYVG